MHSHSLFAVSSVHRLLFTYDHCRFDEEERLRFYKARDLSRISCHGFQFQVWRHSGETRHLVYSIALFIFYGCLHYLLAQQMTRSLHYLGKADVIEYWRYQYNRENLTD